MRNLITDVAGLRVGHAHDEKLASGSTVILFDRPVTAAVDVRGGGPGTRETALLDPAQTLDHADAIVLSGGSAFGLDAPSGTQAFLREKGRGFRIGEAIVPIVPGAIMFDLLGRSIEAGNGGPGFDDLAGADQHFGQLAASAGRNGDGANGGAFANGGQRVVDAGEGDAGGDDIGGAGAKAAGATAAGASLSAGALAGTAGLSGIGICLRAEGEGNAGIGKYLGSAGRKIEPGETGGQHKDERGNNLPDQCRPLKCEEGKRRKRNSLGEFATLKYRKFSGM